MSGRFLKSELPWISGRFTIGDTVTVDIWNLDTLTKIVSADPVSETGGTGYFDYEIDETITVDTTLRWIMSNGTTEKAGIKVFGGYPDTLVNKYSIDTEYLKPNTVDLADTSRLLGMTVSTNRGSLPTTAEINPGTIRILSKPKGTSGWSQRQGTTAMFEEDGLIYFPEVFNTAAGYNEGDSVLVIYRNQSVTIDGIPYQINNNGTGKYEETYIRETIWRVIWNALTSAFLTAGSIGKLIVDFLNASVLSRASETNATTNKDEILNDIGLVLDDTIDILIAIGNLNDLSSADIVTACDSAITNNVSIIIIKGLSKWNLRIDNINYNGDDKMIDAQISIHSNGADVDTGDNPLHSFTASAEYVDKLLSLFKYKE